MTRLSELGGKRLPFLRWSMVRMLLGRRRLETEWQVGDGRELALARHVEAEARRGDLDDVIRVIDDFAYHRSFLINVGDEKGEILDAAIRRNPPRQLLELGTYCGYSALRSARVMPEGARLVSIEFNAENAAIARRIWDHAGIGEELTVLVGTLGDGDKTITSSSLSTASPADRWTSSSSITTSLPICPTSGGSWTRAGCTPARWSSPTTSGSLERPTTASSCRPRKDAPGGRASTKPTSSTNRCSRTWCSNRSTWDASKGHSSLAVRDQTSVSAARSTVDGREVNRGGQGAALARVGSNG